MADTVQLTVNKREGSGTLSAKKLRRQGQLPAVVYGHKEETLVVALSHDEFVKALRLGARLVELKNNGHTEAAIIQDVQWDHLGMDVLHVDFRRVSKDERVVVPVPLHLAASLPVWRPAAFSISRCTSSTWNAW